MAISFTNIRSGEKRTLVSEPAISAFFNSTNLHVNATVGQDMGWRLAPETVKRMKQIQKDPQTMQQIAATFQLPLDGIGLTDILNWISREDSQNPEVDQDDTDYERQYEEELRALEEVGRKQSTSGNSRGAAKPKESAPAKTEDSKTSDSNSQSDSAKIEPSNNDTKEK